MSTSRTGPRSVFVEVADRVWVARHEWFDVNVSLVAGDRGLLVVDTHASGRAARGVVDEIRGLGVGEVTGVVNTHEHFDHTFGNHELRRTYGALPIHAHEVAAARTVAAGERVKGLYEADLDDPHRDEVRETPIVTADHTFSSVAVIDLGDRAVELVHPGRGHTAGDLVVRVDDADVLLAGDLVEASDDGSATPEIGDDSHLLEWPLTLDLVLQLLGADTVVVPGHGPVVDREHVRDQRAELGVVAETIRDLAGRGVPVGDALDAAEWPWPLDRLTRAVPLAYAQLPRAQKRLPLV